MADIGITKFRVQIPRDGATPSTPGFAQSEGQDPVNPPGSPTGIYVPYLGATGGVNLGEYGLTTGNLIFDTTPTNIPTGQGAMYWDVDDETVALVMNGAIQKVGEDSFYQVKNQTGSNIAKGVAVRFAGTVGNSGRLLIAPFLADGTYPSTYFMGVTMEAIDNGEDGKVMWFGRIRGINTNAYNEDDILYASTTVAGGFQTTIPQAPNNIVEVCAVVTKSATVGTIFVRPTLGSNINRDEGVKITSGTTGDLLQLQSSGLWENRSLATIGIPTGTGASGRVTFWTGANTISGSDSFWFDSANTRVGIGNNTPATILHVRPASGTPTLRVERPSGSIIDISASTLVTGGIIGTTTNSPLTLRTNNSDRIVIFSAGNVAIGTTTDAGFRLDVNGTARVQGNLNVSTGGITLTGAQTIQTSTGNLTLATAGGNGNILLTPNGTGNVQVKSNVTGTSTSTLRIDNGGTSGNEVSLEFFASTTDSSGSLRVGRIKGFFTGTSFTNANLTFQSLTTGNTLIDTITLNQGNALIGTTTNAGFRLDVNGTTRLNGLQTFQGTTASDTAPLGSELLTSSNWTTTGWTGDFVNGFTNGAGNTTALSNTLAGVVNTYYQIAYTITGRTAGSVTIAFGGQSIGTTATGAFGPRATTTGNLTITPTADFNGTIVISIKTIISTSSATTSINSSDGTVRMEIRATTATSNTLVGIAAGRRITTGANNSFIGVNAGQNNTSGSSNSFFGSGAGLNNTTGTFNSFFGLNAGSANTTGTFNSFFGVSSGVQNTASNNSFFGGNSGFVNTTGANNSFFGVGSGSSNTTGDSNIFIGNTCGQFNSTGSNNTFIGRNSGRLISSGTNLTISNNSVFLGFDTRANADSETNQTVIGYNAIGLGSNTTVIGNSSTTFGRWWGNLLLGTSTNSGFLLDVNGTARIQGNLTTNITATQVMFAGTGGLLSGSSDLLWDNTNKRLRIGGGSDSGESLQVAGSIKTTAHIQVNSDFGLRFDNDNRVKINTAFGWEITSWTKTVFSTGNVEISAGTLGLRASSTASSATQIPVFTADPSSTMRTLVTRTPAQLYSDMGGISQTTSTFTPALTCFSGDRTWTVSTANGYYIKTGKLVFFNIYVSVTSTTTPTSAGALRVTNLPFTSESSTENLSTVLVLEWVGTTDTDEQINLMVPYIPSGSTVIQFKGKTQTSLLESPVITNGSIRLTGTYYTS